jgi:nicotinamide mononucleotide transporter
MQALLQLIYVVLALWGFWQWSRARGVTPTVRRWPPRAHGLVLALLGVATLLIADRVAQVSDAAWPRLDTLVMLGGLLATYMVTASLLENWPYWIVIDLASIFLYWQQGLIMVALLYVIYAVIAVIGWRQWARRLASAR